MGILCDKNELRLKAQTSSSQTCILLRVCESPYSFMWWLLLHLCTTNFILYLSLSYLRFTFGRVTMKWVREKKGWDSNDTKKLMQIIINAFLLCCAFTQKHKNSEEVDEGITKFPARSYRENSLSCHENPINQSDSVYIITLFVSFFYTLLPFFLSSSLHSTSLWFIA